MYFNQGNDSLTYANKKVNHIGDKVESIKWCKKMNDNTGSATRRCVSCETEARVDPSQIDNIVKATNFRSLRENIYVSEDKKDHTSVLFKCICIGCGRAMKFRIYLDIIYKNK